MANIYRIASYVRIWVGNASIDRNSALTLLLDIVTKVKANYTTDRAEITSFYKDDAWLLDTDDTA